MTFTVIMSYIFPENFIEIAQWERFSASVLTIFLVLSNFLTFPCCKETNDVSLSGRVKLNFPEKSQALLGLLCKLPHRKCKKTIYMTRNYQFLIEIYKIYFPITDRHIKFEVIIVCIRDVMAVQILWDNSIPLGGKGKRN